MYMQNIDGLFGKVDYMLSCLVQRTKHAPMEKEQTNR